MSSRRRIVLVLVVVTATLAAGCTDNGSSASSRQTTTSSFGVGLSACTSPATTSTISQRCRELVFSAGLAKSGSAAVRKLSAPQQLGFARGLCAYAQALAASTRPRPLFSELAKSTATSWGVKPPVFREIYKAAKVLCPEELATIDGLPETRDPIEVSLSIGGSGPVGVTFTSADGNTQQQKVTAPWTLTIELKTAINMTLSARADGSTPLTCSISVSGSSLAEHEPAPQAGEATCSVSADTIASAAEGTR